MVTKLTAPPAPAKQTPAAVPGLPGIDRLPEAFISYQHTLESWTAYITAAPTTEADAIYTAVVELRAMIETWMKTHGASRNPGVDAIRAVGVPLPKSVAEFGTGLGDVRDHLPGLDWALMCFLDWMQLLPDPQDPRESPENVRRLLGYDDEEDGE